MKTALLYITGILACSGVQGQTTYFVKTNGSDANSGLSWEQPKQNVQAAIDAAVAGDQIWIAKGIYYPTSAISGQTDPRAKSFIMKAGVSLYGGFDGTESTLKSRSMEDLNKNDSIQTWEFTNTTLLSGDIDGEPDEWIYNPSKLTWSITGNTNNSYHVIYSAIPEKSIVVTLNGLTITGGNADGAKDTETIGGGVYDDTNSLQLEGCIIQNNYAAEEGGGAFLTGYMTGCLVTGNVSGNTGGGVSNYDVLQQSTLTYNTAASNGGAIDNSGYVIGCHIYFNSAENGGGIYNMAYTDQSWIFSNYALQKGGGVYNDGETSNMQNDVVYNNAAFQGGGVYNSGNILYATIAGNTAKEGGGTYSDNSKMMNSVLWNNDDENAGSGTITYTASSGTALPGEGNVALDLSTATFDNPVDFRGIPMTQSDTSSLFAANYDLIKDSPCIGVGKVVAAPTVDILNRQRSRTSSDLGAYIYSPVLGMGKTHISGESYPNPFADHINLRFESGIRNIRIYSTSGELIYQENEAANHTRIETSSLLPGIYLVKVETDTGEYVSRMIKL